MLYVPPSKADAAWTNVYGTARAFVEWATEENIDLAIAGLKDRSDSQANNIRAVLDWADLVANIAEKVRKQISAQTAPSIAPQRGSLVWMRSETVTLGGVEYHALKAIVADGEYVIVVQPDRGKFSHYIVGRNWNDGSLERVGSAKGMNTALGDRRRCVRRRRWCR